MQASPESQYSLPKNHEIPQQNPAPKFHAVALLIRESLLQQGCTHIFFPKGRSSN
jgi:hypothetical protein